jgi:hypothetical protein
MAEEFKKFLNKGNLTSIFEGAQKNVRRIALLSAIAVVSVGFVGHGPLKEILSKSPVSSAEYLNFMEPHYTNSNGDNVHKNTIDSLSSWMASAINKDKSVKDILTNVVEKVRPGGRGILDAWGISSLDDISELINNATNDFNYLPKSISKQIENINCSPEDIKDKKDIWMIRGENAEDWSAYYYSEGNHEKGMESLITATQYWTAALDGPGVFKTINNNCRP